MLKKSFTRLNQKASSRRRSRRKRYLKIAALSLMLTLSVGAVFGLWSNSSGTRKPQAAAVSPMLQPAPKIPSASNPSKEYIYAGGKLIATEESANNVLPNVSITSPANNFTFAAGSNLLVTLNASDPDGSISQVQILQEATPLGLATAAGGGVYNFTWTSVPAGTYSLTANATDNSGAVAASTAVTVISNSAPSVGITFPANNSVFTSPADITINANASDSDGTISKVEFFQGASLIGTDTTSPYSVTWTGVTAGTYSLTAKATDNNGGVTTSPGVTVISNALPNVGITSPANAAVFTAPANIPINANASDSDGTISKVDFYQGANLIGTDTTSPYSVTWSNVPTGSYSLTAKATDNNGAVATSAAVSITVNSPANVPPTVNITSPANNTVLTAPASFTINANASDSDGTISKVEFYQGATLIGTDTTSPYSVTWTNVPAGTYSLTAKATDNNGAVTTSAGVTVISNALPTVSITNPANNTVLTAPASFTISANASDSGGTVSKVDFYQGTTQIGTDSTSPYSFNWTNVPAGTYALTAKVTDNLGAVVTSAVVTVVSNAGPAVSITGPSNNAIFSAPANITINVNASDSDGSISKVDFYQGATLIGSDSTSPYSVTWTNVPVGSYSLTAQATDNLGAVATSASVAITAPTFYDDFNDNSLDSGKWTVNTPGSPVVVSEQSQQLRITLPPSTSIFYNGITSNAAYDMRGGIAQVELVQPVSQAGYVENAMRIDLDANNYFLFNVGAGSIMFRARVNGTDDQLVINFDPVAHRYWRIRHDKTSNLVNFETSPDGLSWTTRKAVSPGFSLVGLKFLLYAGTWGNGNASPGAAIYNDFQFFAGPCTPPGSVLISEFRLRGSNGSNDEYIELYNNSDQAIGVCTTDNSSGWALVSSDGVTRFVVPAGAVIPAHGHYLATGGGYSLSAYGGSTNGNIGIGVEVPDNTGLALFNSANPANFILANRLDAVGFTTSGTLYREGAGLSVLGANSGQCSFFRKLNPDIPQDTGDNAADIFFVATDAGNYGGILAILGGPGPENLLSPIQRTVSLPVTMLDPAVGATVAPNRVRDTAAIGPNAAAGTMSLRRTITNNTGKNVTQLRFRVSDITTLNSPGYTLGGAQADMRVLNSSDFTATLSSGQQVMVRGTTVENPPLQSLGGGLNSTIVIGTLTLAQPLAPGQTMNFQWLLGVQQSGSFRFFFSVEAVVQ